MCITEKNFPMFSVKKSDIFILLHLSTTSGPQESNSMLFQRKGIPDLWIAVQNIWNFRKISQMLCTVIHRHNDEGKTAVRWQKLHKSGTMDSLRKGVPAMAIKYTEEQLNSVDKSMLIQMFLNQQEQLEKVSANLHSLDTKMQAMMEQLIIGNKNRFGRSSEKMEDTQQMRFIEVDGTLVFFNEAEAVCDLDAPEPETLEATPERKKKTKGKKAQDMSELSTNRIDHYMTEEELTAEFGENGWKQLPDAIARRYRFIPAKVEVDEHHVGVVARNRAVGGRDAERHLAFVGEFEFVDFAVDAFARRQKALFLGPFLPVGGDGRRCGRRKGVCGQPISGCLFRGGHCCPFRRGCHGFGRDRRRFSGGSGFGLLHCGAGLFCLRSGAERNEYREDGKYDSFHVLADFRDRMPYRVRSRRC